MRTLPILVSSYASASWCSEGNSFEVSVGRPCPGPPYSLDLPIHRHSLPRYSGCPGFRFSCSIEQLQNQALFVDAFAASNNPAARSPRSAECAPVQCCREGIMDVTCSCLEKEVASLRFLPSVVKRKPILEHALHSVSGAYGNSVFRLFFMTFPLQHHPM